MVPYFLFSAGYFLTPYSAPLTPLRGGSLKEQQVFSPWEPSRCCAARASLSDVSSGFQAFVSCCDDFMYRIKMPSIHRVGSTIRAIGVRLASARLHKLCGGFSTDRSGL